MVLSSGTRFDGFDPLQPLSAVFASAPPAVLAAGSSYTSQFTAALPPSGRPTSRRRPARFTSGCSSRRPLLRRTAARSTKAASIAERILRLSPFSRLLSPATGTTRLPRPTFSDLNSRVSAVTSGAQTRPRPTYRTCRRAFRPPGSPPGARLTLYGSDGQEVVQSDGGGVASTARSAAPGCRHLLPRRGRANVAGLSPDHAVHRRQSAAHPHSCR